MLKIFMRMGLILLVAGAVAGAWYFLAGNMGFSLSTLPGGRERPQVGLTTGAARANAPQKGDFQNAERGGENHASGGNLGGIAVQLGKVALITLGVVGVQWVGNRVSRRRKPVNAVPA